MFWLFIIVAVALIAVFLFISSMSMQQDVEQNTEINIPDNSIGKPVPRLYGKSRLYGNCLYYSQPPYAVAIRKCN